MICKLRSTVSLSNIKPSSIMNEELDKKFEEIMQSVMQETFNNMKEGKSLMVDVGDYEPQFYKYEVRNVGDLETGDFVELYYRPEPSYVDCFFKYGFDRELISQEDTKDLGRGVRTALCIKDTSATYGEAIIKVKLLNGFDRFLVFDDGIAQQLYGQKKTLLEQLKSMLPVAHAHRLYNECYLDAVKYAKIAGAYDIRGAIFKWDGALVCMVYDLFAIVPYSITYDNGNTFQTRVNEDLIHRLNLYLYVDIDYRYGHKYKSIDKAIAWEDEDEGPTCFARITKNNGKVNFVNIRTGQELSPVDFDSSAPFDPDAGTFEFEIDGEWYLGCPHGFFANEVEVEMGEGHTWDELL